MITLHDVKSGNSYEVKEGVTLQQVCEQYCQHDDMPIAAALYNNECVGLQTKVGQSGDVDWLPINTMEGNQCIIRTAIFLLVRAVSDLYPDGKVLVKHALRKALYCELEIGHTVTVHDVDIIKKRMHEIVEQDEPISQVIASAETAMEMCRNRHMMREAELLRHVDVTHIMAYQCGQTFDYYMGPLLPSMGYVTCFNLRSYAPGVILETPTVDNPNELPEYKEIPKMARLFLDAEEWGRIVRCEYVYDLNHYIENGTIQDMVDMAEALQEKKLGQLADYIVSRRPKVKVVLIAGPSSAGKTTFCKRLTTQLRATACGLSAFPWTITSITAKIRRRIPTAAMTSSPCGLSTYRSSTSRSMTSTRARKSTWPASISSQATAISTTSRQSWKKASPSSSKASTP